MVITCMMALGLVSCSAADDDLTGDTTTRVNTVASKSNFSLLSYSQTTGAEVNETSNINGRTTRSWYARFFLVVAVTNSPKHDFSRCKSVIYKFLSRDTKSARTKTGQNHGKIKSRTLRSKYPLWNTSVSFAKVQICPLKNEGNPISLIHNSFSYHCTPNVVIANCFDLKRLGLRKLGVKFCFALCWTFSKTRTGNRTKDLPPLLSNPWFGECLNDRHLKMLNFK